MDLSLFTYTVVCIALVLAMIESITKKGVRWSIADMLKVILLVSVMLALGRLVASA
jgi:hypothetical protein